MNRETTNELDEKIRRNGMFRDFRRSDGWKVFEEIMRSGLRSRVNQIVLEDCPPDKTTSLRGEIALLNTLLRAPDLMDSEIEKWREKVEGLRVREERMQYYGLDKLPPQEEPNGQEA